MTLPNGPDSLLRFQEPVLALIDRQPCWFANANSHDPRVVANGSAALGKTAEVCNGPAILASMVAAKGGRIYPPITGVRPGQEATDRTLDRYRR